VPEAPADGIYIPESFFESCLAARGSTGLTAVPLRGIAGAGVTVAGCLDAAAGAGAGAGAGASVGAATLSVLTNFSISLTRWLGSNGLVM
jgi:hypothetical protein